MLFKTGNKPPIDNKTPSKPGKPSKPVISAKGKRAQSDLKTEKQQVEKESAIDSDEYQDMVYDIEYGR